MQQKAPTPVNREVQSRVDAFVEANQLREAIDYVTALPEGEFTIAQLRQTVTRVHGGFGLQHSLSTVDSSYHLFLFRDVLVCADNTNVAPTTSWVTALLKALENHCDRDPDTFKALLKYGVEKVSKNPEYSV